jgi:hypothetical protein
MEMQFYPPGNPPFIDSQSCDTTHWCAALTIDSLECTAAFASCNKDCEEPANFAFIQRNGVPTGPPGPADADVATEVNNNQTLLMNSGDTIRFHMFDAPAPGGGDAFEVVMDDLTTGRSGFMQASAANGFQTTSMATCAGTAFNTCASPYENVPGIHISPAEIGNAVCYYAGDTHPGYNGAGTSTQPDQMTGCQDDLYQNGDLDFLGPDYYRGEWPTGPTPTNRVPSSFQEQFPTSNGQQYSQFLFQTDIALSEYECGGGDYANASSSAAGCTVPPAGPGGFYPYWTQVQRNGSCSLEFGNVSGFGLTAFGQDAQYGSDQFAQYGYPQFIGRTYDNPCAT